MSEKTQLLQQLLDADALVIVDNEVVENIESALDDIQMFTGDVIEGIVDLALGRHPDPDVFLGNLDDLTEYAEFFATLLRRTLKICLKESDEAELLKSDEALLVAGK